MLPWSAQKDSRSEGASWQWSSRFSWGDLFCFVWPASVRTERRYHWQSVGEILVRFRPALLPVFLSSSEIGGLLLAMQQTQLAQLTVSSGPDTEGAMPVHPSAFVRTASQSRHLSFPGPTCISSLQLFLCTGLYFPWRQSTDILDPVIFT